MDNSLQNAKVMRECNHKEIILSAWIMIDDNGLEYKICKLCYRKYRHLAGLTFKICQPITGFIRLGLLE